MYVEGREIVFGRLPLRYVASLRHANWHGHNQRRSSHGERFTLASRTFSTKIIERLFFYSYAIVPLVPVIAAFIRRNCTVWDYNKRQLQGLTCNICGKYCCLFDLYMDRGITAKQFVWQFDGASSSAVADRQIFRTFASEFVGSSRGGNGGGGGEGGGQCSSGFLYKRWVLSRSFVILSYVDRRYGGSNRFRIFERAPG